MYCLSHFYYFLDSLKSDAIFNHMVKYSDPQLDRVFHALSDSTRRAILARLATGEALVTEIAQPFDMSLPAVSKHIGVLEKAGLLHRHKDGRIRRCEFNAAPLETAFEWIGFYRDFWNSQLDSLANFLDKKQKRKVVDIKSNNVKTKKRKEK